MVPNLEPSQLSRCDNRKTPSRLGRFTYQETQPANRNPNPQPNSDLELHALFGTRLALNNQCSREDYPELDSIEARDPDICSFPSSTFRLNSI